MNYSKEILDGPMYGGAIADEIVMILNDGIQDRGRASIYLAGGTTPGIVYRALGKPPRSTDVDWSKVSVFLGDERFVPETDLESNYRMVKETLIPGLTRSLPTIYKIATDKTPDESAAAYEASIKKVEGDAPTPDLVLLGIGEDGHTASLFPNSQFLNEQSRFCVAVKNPKGQSRITITPRVICESKNLFFLLKGEGKAEIARRVLEGDEPVSALPAKIFQQSKGKVVFFLDNLAALKLSK